MTTRLHDKLSTTLISSARSVPEVVQLSGWHGLSGLWLLLLAFAVTACSPDDPVPQPPCKGDACAADASDNDTDASVQDTPDAKPTPTLNFSLETKNGTALSGAVDSVTLELADDKYPDAVGTQVDVVVTSTGLADGTDLELLINKVVVATAQISNGAARFDKQTLDCTAVAASIVVRTKDDVTKVGKSAQLNCSNACTATIEDPGTACLTGDVDPGTPGFQATFTVKTTTPDCTHAHLEFVDADGKTVSSPPVALNGGSSVAVKVTLSAKDKGLVGSKISIVAAIEDEAHKERDSIKSNALVVTVTTEAPVITVQQPLPGQLTLKDDTDPVAPGIQTTLVGTVTTLTTADAGAIQLFIDGVQVASTTLKVDNTFNFPLSFPDSKTYSVRIAAASACGLTADKTVPYSVFASKAALVVQTPAPGQILLAKNDGDVKTASVYETSFVIGTLQPTLNSEIAVFCKKTAPGSAYGSDPVGTAIVTDAANSTISVPVLLDVDLLGTSVTCFAKDNAPNGSQTAEVTFQVALPAPCLDVVLPATAVTVTAALLDVAASAVGLDGATVTAKVKSATGVQYDAVTVGIVQKGLLQKSALPLQFGSPAQNLPDGTYEISFEAIDALGNVASESLCSDTKRTVTLDTTGPVLAIALPSKTTLTTLDDADAEPAQAGYQVTVVIDATDAVQVCLTLSGAKIGCQATAAGATQVTFKGVTLQPGVNSLVVSGADASGNTTTLAPIAVTLISDAPAVSFISPSASLSTVNDSLPFEAKVADGKGQGVSGALTEVQINGKVDSTVVVTDKGNGVYTFTVGNLSAGVGGVTTVQFGAAASGAPGKSGYSPLLTVTFKSSKPSATLNSPSDGAVFNLVNAACVAGVPDCITKVSAATPNIEDGLLATLTVHCGAADVLYMAAVAGGAVSFDAVTLLNQATCSLVVTAVDLAGQQATSPKVTVSVDRTAPAFFSLESPPAPDNVLSLLANSDINQDPTDGMQVNVQIKVSGLTKGAKIQFDVFDDSGKKTNTVMCTVVNDIGDLASGIVTCGVVSLPDGFKVKLQFSAADLAGNPASKVLVGEVLSAKPDLNISLPPNVADAVCKANADCPGGICYQAKCTVPWNKLSSRVMKVTTLGIPNGGSLRICSDAPGLTSAACATAGFKIVGAAATLVNQAAQVDLSTVPDGVYTFIAEVSALPTVPWTASFSSTFVNGKTRRILIDSVAPSVVTLLPPISATVPVGCLSDKLQETSDVGQPGGKFIFSVTTDEEASVVMQNNKLQVSTGVTTNKSLTVSVPLAAEGTATISAVPVDLVGNVGEGKDLPALNVNTVAPTASFAVPNKAKVLAGDPLEVKIVTQATDVEGELATVHDTGLPLSATQPFSSGFALFPASANILTEGQHSLTAEVLDHCGNKSTIATVPQTVTVDTKPPVLAFVEPAVGAAFADNQDADAAKSGYQVSVQFGTTDAATWTLELGTDCDAVFANCAGFKTISNGAPTAPGGNEPKQLVTVPFGNTTNFALRLKATDANGNVTALERGFTVTLSGCLVQLKGLPAGTINTQSCANKGVSCANVTVPVSVSYLGPCGNITEIKLLKNGTKVAGAAPVDQAATFNLVVADGDSFQLEAVATVAAATKGSSGELPIKADLSNPLVKFVAATVLGQPTVNGDSVAQLGKAKDLDATLGGHQAHAQLKIDDAGLNGGKVVSLQRLVGATTSDLALGSPKVPVALSGQSALIDLQFLTLAEDATNVVTATVQDSAGNLGSASFTAVVDWKAPSALVLNAFGAGDINPRRPVAKLTFAATGDNAGVGTAASYDVRYSKKAIVTESDFTNACDAKALTATVLPKPAAAGTPETVSVTGPDPRAPADPCKFVPLADNGATKYYFAAEALDAAGNRSALSNVISTDAIRLRFAKITLGGAYAAPEFKARVWAAGDLDGDGLGEFALGGGLTAQLCIIYGRAGNPDGTLPDIDLSVASGPNHVCLANAGGLGGPVAKARDLNGDGVDDLAVGFGTGGSGVAHSVLVFLGKKGAKITGVPAVTIKGLYNYGTNAVSRINGVGNFNGDSNAVTKLPLNDLAILDRGTGTTSTLDRVRIVPGSAKWSEALPITIDVNNATDRANNNLVTMQISDQVSFSNFGYLVTGVGNLMVDGDGTVAQYDDLYICHYSSPQQVFLIKGRTVTGDTNLVFSSSGLGGVAGPDDGQATRLRPDPVTGINSFGQYAEVVEFDGNPLPDLAIAHMSNLTGQPQGGLYWVRGAALAGQLGKIIIVTPTLLPGQTELYSTPLGYMVRAWIGGLARIGNFFDQPGTSALRTDLAYGRPTKAPDGQSNLFSLSGDFLRAGSAIPSENSFLAADVSFGDPVKPGNTGFAVVPDSGWGGIAFQPLGDFNKDGLPDLVVGSSTLDGALMIVY